MPYSNSSPVTGNRDRSKEASERASTSRYRFRVDLQIVRGAAADATTSDVTVLDARSGEQHVFTADEYHLCQAANGANTLAGIRQAFQAQTGREISHSKLFAFFRRLRNLGLLQEGATDGAADKPEATPGMLTADSQRLAEAGSDEAVNGPIEQDNSLMIAGPDLVRTTGTPVAEPTAPANHSAGATDLGRSAPPAEASGAIASHTPPTAASEESPDSAAAHFSDGKRAQRRRLMQTRWRGDKPASLRTSADAAPAKVVAAEKSERPRVAKAEEAEKAEKSAGAGITGADFEDLKLLALSESEKTSRAARQGVRRRQRGAGRVEGGSAGPGTPAAPKTAENPTGPAGPGGPGGPPHSTAAEDFGAAFGGGELRAMLGGALEGRGLGGGAMQNLLAGLAQRGRAGRQEALTEGAPAGGPAQIALFNPNAPLGIVAALVWPLKYLLVPLLLLVPAVVRFAYQQRELLTQDIKAFDASVVGTIILGLMIVNFTCRLTQATFIRGFDAPVKQFGVTLTFGMPRFFVDLGGIATLDRRGQLWVHAAPLIARLGLFCFGMLLWFTLRQSASSSAHLALVVGQIGLLAFLLTAQPLWPSDGYRWLVTYFGHPTLRAEALGRMPDGGFPEAGEESDEAVSETSAATFYVLAVALAVSVLALVAQAYFDIATSGNIRVLTAAFLLAICAALAAWVIAIWKYGRGRQIELVDPDATQRILANWAGQADLASERPADIGTIGKVLWAVIACALLAVAFLPYRYNPSGTFEILPTERTAVVARTSGDLEQILVHEGDWVKANQALAKLSSDDQQREITVTRAELDRARAQLAQFAGKSTTQESDPGMDALNRSIADAFSDEPESAGAKSDATATNYTKTQAERAARAEVERLTRKLAYARDQLADTTVRAPKEGRVMTPNVHLLTGIWLRRGAELLSLADTRTLEAQIDIPEADIASVKVGDKVRLRPWSNEDREIAGTVTEIAPAAQARLYGTVVRVRASIPNDEASLRPAMTGYAKIDGDEMRVWEAFLSRIIRIVRVEMWSWIP